MSKRPPRELATATLDTAQRLVDRYARQVARIPNWVSSDQRRRLIADAGSNFRADLESAVAQARLSLGGDGRYDFRWEARLRATMQAVNSEMLAMLTGDATKAEVRARAQTMLNFRATRIAVSEMNNAVVERTLAGLEADPTVLGVRWVTTSAHPCSTCVRLASEDRYGMGGGIFPVDRVPLPPHPHCRCTRSGVRTNGRRGRAAAAASPGLTDSLGGPRVPLTEAERRERQLERWREQGKRYRERQKAKLQQQQEQTTTTVTQQQQTQRTTSTTSTTNTTRTTSALSKVEQQREKWREQGKLYRERKKAKLEQLRQQHTTQTTTQQTTTTTTTTLKTPPLQTTALKTTTGEVTQKALDTVEQQRERWREQGKLYRERKKARELAQREQDAQWKLRETTATAKAKLAEAVRKQVEVEFHGEVSLGFRREIEDAMKLIPEAVKEILAATNSKLKAGRLLVEVDPSLKGLHPRGWPTGATWEHVSGVYSSHTRTAITAEYAHDLGARAFGSTTTPVLVRSVGTSATFRHEAGHAIDQVLNIRNTRAYQEAYAADVAAIRPTDYNTRQKMQYFLQEGDAGRSEAFAEGFAAATGGRSNTGYQHIDALRDKEFEEAFPRTMRYIREKLRDLIEQRAKRLALAAGAAP